jgi:hypothetical protein
MSVKDFLEKLNADKKLQGEFVETQLVPFAKKNGFNLTAKDFELFQASLGKDAGVSGAGWCVFYHRK